MPSSTIAFTAQSLRERLTASRTYYVRTDGGDGHTGLVDTAAGAFLTLQQAWDTVADSLDLNGYNVTIQIADGTYTGGIITTKGVVGNRGVAAVNFRGNTTTPANVVLNVSAGVFKIGSGACGSFQATLTGFKMTSSAGSAILMSGSGNGIAFNSIDFGACSASGAHIYMQHGGFAIANGAYTISSGAGYHIISQTNSGVAIHGQTVTLTGTPAFSSIFAQASICGYVAAETANFVGAATGTRYLATTNGVITVGGGGATFLPGSIAGSVTNGGQYV